MTNLDLIKTDMTFEKNGEESQIIIIKPHTDISNDELLHNLKCIFDAELEMNNVNILLKLKGLPVDKITQAIKYSLSREDLKDPIMILNIINLIKVYNSSHDSFFENEDIYVSSIEELLDLKLNLRKELKDFAQKVSIYFLSLFKSYSKTSFTPTDNPIEIPNIYKAIFLGTDLFTLSGIFSSSNTFNTEDCVYVNDAMKYVSNLLMKNAISMAFFNQFVGDKNGDRTE